MAAAAWWLLGREADRVESLAAGTLANRTATVAENVDLLMEEVRDGVSDGLSAVGEVAEPRVALAELVEGNPYIAAGFYFRGADSVTAWFGERGDLPSPSSIRGDAGNFPWTLPDFEDDRFLREDVVLPAPVVALQSNAPSDAYVASAPAAAMEMDDAYGNARAELEAPAAQQKVFSQNIALKEQRAAVRKVNVDNRAGLSSGLNSLMDAEPFVEMADAVPLDRQRSDAKLGAAADVLGGAVAAFKSKVENVAPLRRAWVSSVVGDTEQWMAWSGLPNSDNYLGVWLNREAILAELSKAISLSQSDGLRFRLVDAQGGVVAGESMPRYGSVSSVTPELSLAVGSALPQWRIETFRANGANTFGSSFRLVGGLFIVGLSVAILLGSTVLIWQAHRDAREAERKTTFVANVSHELKTPLTSIRLFADMLHDGRVKDPAKQRAYLQTMVNETQRLTRLVNNVLDFSRLERGQRRNHAEAIDLGRAVVAIVASQEDRLRVDGLSVTVATPEGGISARIDRDALEQILLNLLDNAAKYATSGERADVVLTLESQGWCLRVTDYGAGIPASERKQVFAAFHRSDDRLTAERPGCGLGLSIAARLAEEMGGTLTLEDNQPHGCSFILQIHG
ncbi:sensor histidine kinase [Coraliomargarita sp. W4R72]